MVDQKSEKPLCKKQVRVEVIHTANVEVIDENDNSRKGHRVQYESKNFDERSFKEAFDYFDLKRRAVQADVDEEYEQEKERRKEAERLANRSLGEKIISWFIGT